MSTQSRQMQGNRRRDTKPEIAVRSLLHARGLRFRVDARVWPEPGSPRPDIVFRRGRVAVFVDGCFWHSCPLHCRPPQQNVDYWGPKLARNVARDRRNDAALAAAGWLVIRAWEHEPAEEVADRVERAVRERRAPPASAT